MMEMEVGYKTYHMEGNHEKKMKTSSWRRQFDRGACISVNTLKMEAS